MPSDAASTLHAFGLGLLAGTGLVLGAALGLAIDLPHRAIAAVMSLGAGLLLAIATVELTVDAVEASGAMAAAGAIALGAAAFSAANAAAQFSPAPKALRCVRRSADGGRSARQWRRDCDRHPLLWLARGGWVCIHRAACGVVALTRRAR